MENKTGLTNKQKALSLFKWTLRKYLPFSIAYWILLFISFPLVEIFAIIVCTSENSFKEYVTGMREAMIGIPSTGFALIVILFSSILAIIAFSYMHNKRCVDLFGSFPVSRRTLFFARYFAVIVASAVPMIIIGFAGALLGFSNDVILTAFKIMGILLLEIVGNVSFVAFISVCCGTVADVIISYGVINIAYPVCVVICYIFPVNIIPGLYGGYLPGTVFTLFCPLAAPFVAVFSDGLAIHIIWWIGLSVVLMAGCYVLCKKRKAETAQNAFAFAAVELVIKFIACFAAGFGMGWIMAHMGESTSVAAQYIWFVIGLIMGIMVTDILLHLIFHRGLAKYAKSLLECGVVFVTAMVFLMVVVTGAFGYDQRIPDNDSIKEVQIQTGTDEEFIVNGKNVLYKSATDKETINAVWDFHEEITKNVQKYKHQGLYAIVDYSYDEFDEVMYNGMEIKYTLDNGKTFTRTYTRTYGNTKVPKEIRNMANNDALKLTSIPEKYINSIDIYDYREESDYWADNLSLYREDNQIDEEKLHTLVEALKKDVEENGIEYDENEDDLYYIDFSYVQKKGINITNEVDACFYIPETYTNTLQALKDTGYINIAYYYYKGFNSLLGNLDKVTYSNGDSVIYFKTPEGWSDQADIRCVLYNEYDELFLADIDEDITKCEEISKGLWKYTIPKITSKEVDMENYDKVMFYQNDDNQFKYTGGIQLSGDGKNLLTVESFDDIDLEDSYYMSPVCKYHWSEYTENNQ